MTRAGRVATMLRRPASPGRAHGEMLRLAANDQILPDDQFTEVRSALLKVSSRMSCSQALDLADLLHTVIRMRRPQRPLQNLEALFCGEGGG